MSIIALFLNRTYPDYAQLGREEAGRALYGAPKRRAELMLSSPRREARGVIFAATELAQAPRLMS